MTFIATITGYYRKGLGPALPHISMYRFDAENQKVADALGLIIVTGKYPREGGWMGGQYTVLPMPDEFDFDEVIQPIPVP